MGKENPLFLMGGDFKFHCLQFKNPVGIPKVLMFFSSGDESSIRGMKTMGNWRKI